MSLAFHQKMELTFDCVHPEARQVMRQFSLIYFGLDT